MFVGICLVSICGLEFVGVLNVGYVGKAFKVWQLGNVRNALFVLFRKLRNCLLLIEIVTGVFQTLQFQISDSTF